MAQSAAAVTLEEYLRTDYHPDVEYLNGELKEKPVVGFPRLDGKTAYAAGAHFRGGLRPFGGKPASECAAGRRHVTK